MKKIVLLISLFMISANAFAAGNDFKETRRNPANTADVPLLVATPPSSAFRVIDVSGGSVLPKHILMGTGISYDGTTISIDGVPATHITGLSAVATTGVYSDLSGKPSIPSAQIQSDWMQASTGSLDYIKNKPTLATVSSSGAYNDLIGTPSLATVATTGAYSDLAGKPSLATVATTGSYNDLSSKPTIPSAQINSDWTAASGISQILNKPTLSTVATTGAYADLTGKPSIPSAQVNSDWNAVSGVSQISNKPSLATVATSGAYSDLTGAPSIGKLVVGTSVKSSAFAVAKSSTVASGNAVFHLTDDGTSTGNALCPNGNVYLDSLQLRCDNEASSPCSFGQPALSNSNKTITVAVNKSTGINVALVGLTLLGAPAAANGSVVKSINYCD